eukprot:gene3996-4997_t
MAKQKGGGTIKGQNVNNGKKHDRQVKQALRRRKDRQKHGDEKWRQSFQQFLNQLQPLGYTIKDVAGDGNCLFRSIADQLENAPQNYQKYRQAIVTFIEQNKDIYSPFIDDEEFDSFEDYIREMRTDGEWGGNIEIQAASLIYTVNVTIHQLNQPQWQVINHFNGKTRMIHLSYHDGEHYNSVRPINETFYPAGSTAAPKPNFDYNCNGNGNSGSSNGVDEKIIKIMEATGIKSVKTIKDALDDCQNDIDVTIDYLIAIAKYSNSENDTDSNDKNSSSDNSDKKETVNNINNLDELIVSDSVDDSTLNAIISACSEDNNFNQNDTTETSISSSSTTTTTTTSTSTSTGKVSKNPYKGVKKQQTSESNQQQNNNNSHLSNRERKKLAKEGESNNNGKNNQNPKHKVNRADIVDDSLPPDLGTLKI